MQDMYIPHAGVWPMSAQGDATRFVRQVVLLSFQRIDRNRVSDVSRPDFDPSSTMKGRQKAVCTQSTVFW